jgi:RimJ/RimL family protein N-acetyltransferase
MVLGVPEERLLLEPLRVDHAAEMATVLADPALYTFTGGSPPSEQQLEERYGWQVAGSSDGIEGWHNWIVRQIADGRAVGFVQATVTGALGAETAALAWLIGTDFQAQGYAREAATLLVRQLAGWGVSSYTANIHPDHHASQAVAASIGLQPTEDRVGGEVRWQSA